ncbi:BnaC02g19600D [Brassica napus]|uniref:(rape) hypothetical protein n=1 Tax=Brassica napus TaxID=3708 RepID=A0A078HZG0_BRANA|nr:unnamed protein product [Brassica napus]CDY42986.1 BnaC02g19600D [Brassica napus]
MIIKRQSTRDVREYLQIVLNRFPDNCEIYDKITKLLKNLRLARYFLFEKINGVLIAKPEFRDASEFLNKVKERLQDEHAYKSLLEILRMFKENKKNFTEVHHEKDRIIASHTDSDLKPEHRDLDHERSSLKESKEDIRHIGTKNDISKKKLTLTADDSPEISNQAREGDKFCGAVDSQGMSKDFAFVDRVKEKLNNSEYQEFFEIHDYG